MSFQDSTEALKLLDDRAKRYANLSLDVLPVILVVGKEIEKPSSCYVCLYDKIWEFPKPINALNATFQLLMLLNVAYPKDCEHIWLIIQKCVYDITTNQDQYIPVAIQMIGLIKQKMSER